MTKSYGHSSSLQQTEIWNPLFCFLVTLQDLLMMISTYSDIQHIKIYFFI